MIRLLVPSETAESVADIDLDNLQARGIDSLILDLDNTIAPWQKLDVPESIERWIAAARARGMKLCIASNTRNTRRLNQIAERFGMYAISRALKPRRKGFRTALHAIASDPARAAVIGDQLLTDVFGGNRAGLYTILVKPLHKREFIGTKVSRVLERALLGWFRWRGLLGTKAGPGQSERKERA